MTLNDEPDRIDVLRVPALHIIISQIEHSSEQKVGGKKREIRSFFFYSMRISILIGNRDLERGSDLEKGAAEKGKTFLSLPSQLNSKGQQNQMDGVHTHVFLHHSNLEQKKRRILLTKEKCVCMYIYLLA